ncbi:hypothetical protein ACXHXG_20620 [Rhizobium sp. LEGMi198b]|uniref:hypothetical protein n=1 Tax=Rhizobium sp. CB3090 TaxID=3039156 RepID=UPI0024B142F3|nr:hypothetical protein [Rhizobium sp. CB3090]WFU12956.1 hypothetical protein QA646_29210 [Rhizobium sp. CB3090]
MRSAGCDLECRAGFNGRVRDEIQTDILGRRVASIFDPVGHIWALVERRAERVSNAAEALSKSIAFVISPAIETFEQCL